MSDLQILVVDDDAVDRAAIRRALTRQDLHVSIVEAVDVASALVASTTRVFDCGVIDYHLPDGTALDLVRELSMAPRGALPVVILTGSTDDDLAIAALQQGAQDYLAKHAMDGRVLVRAIRYAIERARVVELQQRLLHADRLIAIGHLAAGVAHEVNNPASAVLANLELLSDCVAELQRRIADPGAASSLAGTLAECSTAIRAGMAGIERISSVTGSLRNFAKIERDEVEQVDLDDVIESTCVLLNNEIRHRAQLVRDFQPLPHVIGHRAKLTQVFINLLMNAIQAIEPGAAESNEIRLAARVADATITLTIEDTGVGISSELSARAFQPFFSTKPREHATGLGLSLCQDIVRQHGGSITLRSEVGVGTRVDVILPIDAGLRASAPTRTVDPVADPGRRQLGGRARVLIVDDEPAIVRTYKRLLEPQLEVAIAEGGRQGLAILAQDPDFDVIVCDLMMPEVDGVAVYEQLRREHPALLERVVFWTGGVFTERSRSFLANVDNLFLHKPITRQQLLDAVSRVVASTAR
ncbi:MAG: response regulator [Deltaproteobacteria bacterium]|nr:response regulator [Deltaproteobacteria bacterium]